MDQREEIKNKIDIVDLAQGYFPLKKSGRNFKAVCPFHTEKTPSFMVSQEKQIWHCFGACNEGGDIFGFVMKMEGLDFFSALKMLADRAGVKLQRETRNYSEAKEKKDKLYEINEIAAKYYEKILFAKEGLAALNYLKKRGLDKKSIEEFRLGFAPKKSDLLEDLKKIGFTESDMLAAGIAKKPFDSAQGRRDGKLLEYFWDRIIFPITDSAGSVIGFSARTLKEKIQPKYLNTPETDIYHKSNVLYGFDKAKKEIRRLDHIILVEGNMDAIASNQAGVKNVAAVSGTAFTEQQLLTIKRFTKNIKLAFDVDTAGSEATKKAIEMAMREGFNIKVIEVPEGKDPADAALKDKKIWANACKNASYVINYLFEKVFKKHNLKDILGKKEIARELLGVIKKIPEDVEQEHYLKELGKLLDISEESLKNALGKVEVFSQRPLSKETKEEKKDSLEERLLGLLTVAPEYKNFFFRNIEKEDINEEPLKAIFDFLKSGKNISKETKEKADLLKLKTETIFEGFTQEKLGEEIFYLVKRLKKKRLSVLKRELQKKLEEAEGSGDSKKTKELLKELDNLLKKESVT